MSQKNIEVEKVSAIQATGTQDRAGRCWKRNILVHRD